MENNTIVDLNSNAQKSMTTRVVFNEFGCEQDVDNLTGKTVFEG